MDLELSPADAMKLFQENEVEGTSSVAPVPENIVEPAPAPVAKVDTPKQPEQETNLGNVAAEPEGVATKDGKHVIPYSVLQSERTRAATAERQLRETLDRIAALEARQSDPNKQAKQGDAANTQENDTEAQERLAMLEEDFPTVAAELKAMRDQVKALQGKLQPIEESTANAEQERANQMAMSVQDAIDSLPKLAHIQAADAEAFELAKQFDTTLRDRPEWQGRPIQDRFAKVIELVESTKGAIEVPGQKPPTKQDQEALRKAAEQKLSEVEKAIPTSLTQFPSGSPAATDEQNAVSQMSHSQIASKMARMSPEQLDAYLANL